MTEWIEQRTIPISVGILLRDAYRGGSPVGKVSVYEMHSQQEAIRSRTAYFFTRRMLPDTPLIRVTSQFYLDEEIEPDTAEPERTERKLTPRHCYPFPAGATLIQGRVVAQDGSPVADLKVWVREEKWLFDEVDLSVSRTAADGVFVLCVPPLTEERVLRQNARYLVKSHSPNHPTKFLLKVEDKKGRYKLRQKTVRNIEEGRTTRVGTLALTPS